MGTRTAAMAVMRPDFCTDVPAPAREGPLMVRLRVPEEALRWGVLAGVALLLLTPFVVTSETFFPFVVGKALWSRSLIEIVFMLWAVLALKPEYRPPRSRLLILLAAGLGVSLLAACFGVSFQRSMWSEYERMQGVVDLAHWFALAVVLASVLRSGREWRALLCLNLGAGAAMACLVIARYHQWDVPFYGDLQEQHLPRMSGPLGNPIYLSAYLLFNLVVALGFMARSCLPAAAAPAAQARKPRDRRRRPAKRRALQDPRWMRLLWAIVVALHSWGLVLAGSVGGFAGLFASLGFVAVAYAFLARGPWRRIAVIALGVAAVLLGISFLDPGRMATPWLDRPVPWKVAKLDFQRPSVQARLAAWETGVKGFTERPVLGWGPGNFATVFGRFASGYATTVKPHDQAHGKLIEVASTTGALGLAAYLALWSWTFLAVRQAARGMDRGDRALALFAGAALAGHFVQSQSLFDTATNSLQYTLLFAFVVWLERPAFESGGGGGGGGGGTSRRGRAVRAGAVLAALILGGVGLATNVTIYRAAHELYRAEASERFMFHLERGIDGFEPLAGKPRKILFENLARNWKPFRKTRPDEALRLLAWADAQAAAALAAEPENWTIAHALARMYRAVASTEPEYAERAQRRLERGHELAPNRQVFFRPLDPPDALDVRRLEDGRYELLWRRSDGAGYHQVGKPRADGRWRTLLYSYDPDRTSFIPPGSMGPGTYRYAIKACKFPTRCTTWVEWPPVTVTADF